MKSILHVLNFSFLFVAVSTQAAINWDQVTPTTVHLFYAGESSLEWVYSKRNHDGAAKYRKRKRSCVECHLGDEAKYGNQAVGGNDYESAPLAGRNSYIEAQLKMAIEDDNLHVRLSWPRSQKQISWPIDTDLEGIRDTDHAAKVTVMLDDGSVEEFTWGGCWAVCHSDQKNMPHDGNKEKYLAQSRSDMHRKRGGGDNLISDSQAQAFVDKGMFLEYWQAAFTETAFAGVSDGLIFKERIANENTLVSASGNIQDNNWSVEFTRPLIQEGSKKLITGTEYTLSISLHDQYTAGRYHLVSLERHWLIENNQPRVLTANRERR